MSSQWIGRNGFYSFLSILFNLRLWTFFQFLFEVCHQKKIDVHFLVMPCKKRALNRFDRLIKCVWRETYHQTIHTTIEYVSKWNESSSIVYSGRHSICGIQHVHSITWNKYIRLPTISSCHIAPYANSRTLQGKFNDAIYYIQKLMHSSILKIDAICLINDKDFAVCTIYALKYSQHHCRQHY